MSEGMVLWSGSMLLWMRKKKKGQKNHEDKTKNESGVAIRDSGLCGFYTHRGNIFYFTLWERALFQSKIDSHIAENRLATTDIYALLIYSAFMFFCSLFLFYWIFMTVLMKCMKEKWLNNLFGREYEEYCRRVNRCIPWLPGSRRKSI